MINSFKRGLEYNKLAKSLNGIYQMIDNLIKKRYSADINEEMLVVAYLSRIEIIDRLVKYKWAGNTPIVVPMMPGYKKTLGYALTQTIERLVEISDEVGFKEEVEEVLDRGMLFYKVEAEIPESLKKRFK